MDVTEQAESGSFDLDVYDNGTLTVRVIDRQDGYHDGTAKIMCFDRTAPTVTAGISGEPLHIEAKDDLSGVAGIQVNGLLFTTLDGGKLDILLSPWSPPVYMKTDGERNNGGKLKPEYRKRWAEYICRYIEEYRSRGYHVAFYTFPKGGSTADRCYQIHR